MNLYITSDVFKTYYADNIQTMLQRNNIQGHAPVFIVHFSNVFISLIFSLADYLVWLTGKSLDSLISIQNHVH